MYMFSMGGAIAVHTASLKLIPSLVGLVVIDVVEGGEMLYAVGWHVNTTCLFLYVGSAMNALSSMQNFLRGRPQSFESLERAIEWR